MSNVLLVSLDVYQDAQWQGLVEDMRGLIRDGLEHRPNFVAHHANKRGLTYGEALAAIIEAQEKP